jgi:hypothetical protein
MVVASHTSRAMIMLKDNALWQEESNKQMSMNIFTPLRVGWPPTPQVYFGP